MDYFDSREKCANYMRSVKKNKNPRYKIFQNNTHFTAGDEDQFEQNRNATCVPSPSHFEPSQFPLSPLYSSADNDTTINTFRYIFNKFKKGTFVQIRDNRVSVFLPFSKVKFFNEWGDRIKCDPDKFPSIAAMYSHIAKLESNGRIQNPPAINAFPNSWYANNCLVRSEYPVHENDTNNAAIKNMFDELCAERDVPDIEFFVNRRDFPLLMESRSEPYFHIWDSMEKDLVSHKYDTYAPILSMSGSDLFADVLIPTHEDWTRVQETRGKFFPKARSCPSPETFESDWDVKRNVAVFRGSSTGAGVTRETNPRLGVSHLSTLHKDKLDAGITRWNLRPRKLSGEEFLQTIDIHSLSFGLTNRLSQIEQSRYKYVVHIQGHVSAFRLSTELSMNCVLLIVESEWKLWYQHLLVPYRHFVPVKSDLSDLMQRIDWCRENDGLCRQIALDAREFHRLNLKRDSILNFLQKRLNQIKAHTGTFFYDAVSSAEMQYEDELKLLSRTDSEMRRYDVAMSLSLSSVAKIFDGGRSFDFNTHVRKAIFHSPDVEGIEFVRSIFENRETCVSLVSFQGFEFVKKTCSESKRRECVHEAFVSIFGVNSLVKKVPNFNYTYKLDVVTGGGRGGATVYSEFSPGISMRDYLCRDVFCFEEYLEILLQIFLAIQVAQTSCGFVHSDLTPWNITLEMLDRPFTTEYVVNRGAIYSVQSRIRPHIIDYGKSHIVHSGIQHGFTNRFDANSSLDVLTLMLTSYHILFETQKNKLDRRLCFRFLSLFSHIRNFQNFHDLKFFVRENKSFTRISDKNNANLRDIVCSPIKFAEQLVLLSKSARLLVEKPGREISRFGIGQITNFALGHGEESFKMYVDIVEKSKIFSLDPPPTRELLFIFRELLLCIAGTSSIHVYLYKKPHPGLAALLSSVEHKILEIEGADVGFGIPDVFPESELSIRHFTHSDMTSTSRISSTMEYMSSHAPGDVFHMDSYIHGHGPYVTTDSIFHKIVNLAHRRTFSNLVPKILKITRDYVI